MEILTQALSIKHLQIEIDRSTILYFLQEQRKERAVLYEKEKEFEIKDAEAERQRELYRQRVRFVVHKRLEFVLSSGFNLVAVSIPHFVGVHARIEFNHLVAVKFYRGSLFQMLLTRHVYSPV